MEFAVLFQLNEHQYNVDVFVFAIQQAGKRHTLKTRTRFHAIKDYTQYLENMSNA